MSSISKTKQILLVDDDEAGNMLTRIMLEEEMKAPFELLTFTSAKEALGFLESVPSDLPDLILLDINMPGMSGFDFLEACHAQGLIPGEGPRVVLITSSLSPRMQEQAAAYPSVWAVEEKPMTLEAMSAFLGRYMA
ncbi:MAG: response regulator [Bacteroidetes bacterium]|nr:MAG: response regulator [Bacteroidota bacterium]